jgi:hypothetical protein
MENFMLAEMKWSVSQFTLNLFVFVLGLLLAYFEVANMKTSFMNNADGWFPLIIIQLVGRLSQDELIDQLPTFLPALFDAFNNQSPDVRKVGVISCFSIAFLYRTFQWLSTFSSQWYVSDYFYYRLSYFVWWISTSCWGKHLLHTWRVLAAHNCA